MARNEIIISPLFFIVLMASNLIVARGASLLSYHAPVSAMSVPGQFHFLEVPKRDGTSASCGDGTPFSFAFKRGTDANLKKVVIEFGSGLACWNDQSCSDIFSDKRNHLRTPWHDGISFSSSTVSLSTCSGLPSSQIRSAAFSLFQSSSIFDPSEVPFGVRNNEYNNTDAYNDEVNSEEKAQRNVRKRHKQHRWRHLFDDAAENWNYIYVPHCTADAHLGGRRSYVNYDVSIENQSGVSVSQRKSILHSGGYNLLSIISFLERNFPKLESILVVGCGTGATFAPVLFTSEISKRYRDRGSEIQTGWCMADSPHQSRAFLSYSATNVFGNNVPKNDQPLHVWDSPSLSSSLSGITIPENANELHSTVDSLVVSTPEIRFGFYGFYKFSETAVAQHQAALSDTEDIASRELFTLWLASMEKKLPNNFFSLVPPLDGNSGTQCLFSFSTSSNKLVGYEDFMDNVTSNWDDTTAVQQIDTSDNNIGVFQPTFLFSTMLCFVSILFLWILYRVISLVRTHRRVQYYQTSSFNKDDLVPVGSLRVKTPLELWLKVLTKYPAIFLAVSVVVPSTISYLGFDASGRTVNLNTDFETYLAMDSEESTFGEHYDVATNWQQETVAKYEKNCEAMKDPPTHLNATVRNLGSRLPKGDRLDIFYQSPKWSWDNPENVFTPSTLSAIKRLEDRIKEQPIWESNCYQIELESRLQCAPFLSASGRFFDDEGQMENIDYVLLNMLEEGFVGFTDKYFSVENLASNFTKTTIYLRKGVGSKFFEDLYRDVLWPADQNNEYPDVVFSWRNDNLETIEVFDAFVHDAYWSAGTVAIVGIVIFLKIRNAFVFAAAMLGLILSFPTAYYWYYVHFEIRELTVINISALFVMLGIGADDIFLMVEAYAQAPLTLGQNISPGEKMYYAYKKAGGTMLITSFTTAVCFYSNAFSVMLIVREFGIFMGTVVLHNYIHVMTILPSAMLVNEVYLVPLWKRLQEKYSCISCFPVCRNRCPSRYCRLLSSKQSGSNDFAHEKEYAHETDHAILLEHGKPDSCDSFSKVCVTDGNIKPEGAICRPPAQVGESETKRAPLETANTSGSEESFLEKIEIPEPVDQEINRKNTIKSCRSLGIDVDRLNWFDRWLVFDYGQFIYARRWLVVLALVTITIIMGALAFNNFAVSKQDIMLFKHDFNLGRMNQIYEKFLKEYSEFRVEQSASATYAEILEERASQPESYTPSLAPTKATTPSPTSKPPTKAPKPSQRPTSEAMSTPGMVSTLKPVEIVPTLRPVEIAPTQRPTEIVPTQRPTKIVLSRRPTEIVPTFRPTEIVPTQRPAIVDSISPTRHLFSSPAPFLRSELPTAQTSANPVTMPPRSRTVPFVQTISPIPLGTDTPPPPPINNPSTGISRPAPVSMPSYATSAPTPLCPLCKNGGKCADSSRTCECKKGFTGNKCELRVCPATMIDSKTVICSGLGQCEQVDKNDIGKGTFCLCNKGYMGVDCSKEIPKIFKLKETIRVKLVWGISKRSNNFAGLWNKNSDSYRGLGMEKPTETLRDIPFDNSFDLSDPEVQVWLLNTAKAVHKSSSGLNTLSNTKTWIEVLEEEVTKNKQTFPIAKDKFRFCLSLLMEDPSFRRLYGKDIGTTGSGFSGDFLFATLTFLEEVKESSEEEESRNLSIKRWNDFVNDLNSNAPVKAGPSFVQSKAFAAVYREQAIFSTTMSTWAISNGICLLAVLFFIQNMALGVIVVLTVILLVICLMGFVLGALSIEFGPVEAIGVTIFIGLSANYSLHITHAYHNALTRDRKEKVQLSIFATGSPIIAAAITTVGGCGFLLGCRLWILVELGVILCCNTAISLIFSVCFLLAILSIIGPLPYEDNEHLHRYDFRSIIQILLPAKMCKKEGYYDLPKMTGKEQAQ